jgi:hypothetical protein
MGMEGMGSG